MPETRFSAENLSFFSLLNAATSFCVVCLSLRRCFLLHLLCLPPLPLLASWAPNRVRPTLCLNHFRAAVLHRHVVPPCCAVVPKSRHTAPLLAPQQPYFVAETTMPGKSGFDFSGSSQSFNVLAEYLFGKNTKKEKMEMTTPVFTSKNQSDGVKMDMTTPMLTTKMENQDKWKMSFVLPSKYGDPLPKDSSARIKEVDLFFYREPEEAKQQEEDEAPAPEYAICYSC